MLSTIYQYYEHNTAPTISDAYFAMSFVDNSVHKNQTSGTLSRTFVHLSCLFIPSPLTLEKDMGNWVSINDRIPPEIVEDSVVDYHNLETNNLSLPPPPPLDGSFFTVGGRVIAWQYIIVAAVQKGH
jgi:hypothetical protein